MHIKMDKFVHLHNHCTYSFRDGYGLPKQWVEKCKQIGQPAIATTDHGNICSHYEWYKECNKAEIKPILGCELYIDCSKYEIKKKYFHITVLAKNNEGYKNLISLVTESWRTGKKKPISMELVILKQKGLIITSGCPSSEVNHLLLDNKPNDAKNKLKEFKEAIEHFYVEISPWSYERGKILIKPLMKMAKELNIPMVATMDCHYIEKDQSELQEILLCIQSNDNMNNPNKWSFDQTDLYLKTRQEMEDSFHAIFPEIDVTEALDNTVKIAEMVDFTFNTTSLIEFDVPNKNEYLYNLCLQALKEKGLSSNAEYKERFEYEYGLIVSKNFVDYFLIVYDLVNWAKSHGILVGPGRGSAAGSLMCYLLRITEVDPIKWGLMFERFIDINREDLPDIDMDFEDDRRPDIIKYLQDKYGKNRVSAVATYSTFKGKSIVSDYSRIYKMPFDETNKLKSIIIERSGGDSRASYTLEDTFNQFDFARKILEKYPFLKTMPKLEGQIRGYSTHASGIVVSKIPLNEICAIHGIDDVQTLSLDYKSAASVGLIKLDILGLNTLSCISKALRLIKERTGKEIDIYNIDLEDKKVYEGFKDPKKLFGIFQFDGQSVNQVCRQMLPENFEELSAINALSRPGPMHGMDTKYNQPITTIYISRKWGKLPVEYVHPLMKSITEETQGVVIYQEQVMKTMRAVGDMSWKDTAEIRRLISRSVGVERFNDFKDRFSVGAKKNGLSQDEIDNIWSSICTFGSWAFNKSHSVSYSIISYWTMWLKVYFPIEYYAAMTSTMLQEGKVKRVIKEYLREGYKVLPVDINRSKQLITIDNDFIRLGFTDIKGLGLKIADKIVEHQPYKNIEDLIKRAKPGKAKIELLSKLGSLKSIGGANEIKNTLFGDVREKEYEENITFEEKIMLCPLSVEFNIYEQWKDFINKYIKYNISPIEQLDPEKASQVIIGIIYDKNIKDKIEEALTRGKEIPKIKDGLSKYCNFVIEDDTDFVTVRVSPANFPKFKPLIFEDSSEADVFMIKGKMGDGIRMLFANEIICLNHLKTKIENKKPLTESEKVLMGLLWRNLKKY